MIPPVDRNYPAMFDGFLIIVPNGPVRNAAVSIQVRSAATTKSVNWPATTKSPSWSATAKSLNWVS